MVERRIKAARFPVVKSLDSFDFKVIPSLNKALVLELARFTSSAARTASRIGNIRRQDPIALGLGLAACQKGSGRLHHRHSLDALIDARDDKP